MGDQDAWAQRWRELSEQVLSEMQTWRGTHPRATLAQIEAEAEARVVRLRARLVEDTALASPVRDWTEGEAADRPCCPRCGHSLQARGVDTRRLTLPGDQPIELTRRYGSCSACGTGLFPSGGKRHIRAGQRVGSSALRGRPDRPPGAV
jgi:hypothetical protein